MNQQIAASTKRTPVNDPIFDHNVLLMQERLVTLLKDCSGVLFTTDASALFDAYLASFPEEVRQHFNCHACKQFIEYYGPLVAISEDGTVYSPFWQVETADVYVAPFSVLARRVLAAKVTGVFYCKPTILGTPESGGWTHFAVRLSQSYGSLHKMTLTPTQAQAEKLEDYRNVMRALDEFSPDDLAQAVRVLSAEALYRSEHLLGAAEWLVKVQGIRRATKNRLTKEALLWRAIGLAPAGFCHPRSGMLGTLLEDIQSHIPFDEIKRRFDAKMHPLQYQRPQAAPTAGAIAQAEKLVETMGIAPSLKRRFARLDEIEAIWRPIDPTPDAARGGVFGHLVPKGHDTHIPIDLPTKTMTWEKFSRTVLPEADGIEFLVPHGSANYGFLTTAVEQDAPPILQWDTADHRNPVAWYVYPGGLASSNANLQAGYRTVTAVVLQPTAWGGSTITHHGESVFFCIEGCRDLVNRGGIAIFPECLKSELHGVRSVIEAYSRAGRFDEPDGPVAAGIRLQKDTTGHPNFRVITKGQIAVYVLDRWD